MTENSFYREGQSDDACESLRLENDREPKVARKVPPDSYTFDNFLSESESQIRARTDNFFSGIFIMKTDHFELWFTDKLVNPAGNSYSASKVIDRLQERLAVYQRFEELTYKINEICWQTAEASADNKATGWSAGEVKYTTIQDGKPNCSEGSFKIGFACQKGFWYIKYFYLSGWDIM